ncbi:MAG: homoserine kinase [Gemmatimonadota bacterium]
MTTGTPLPARVRVPGSTSNLGSGFDTIGLALDRYLEASFMPDDSGRLVVERRGTLERLEGLAGPDLVGETFRAGLAEAGIPASGRVRLDSTIPVVRGLGSSAAALIAGCDLARAALGLASDRDACFKAAFHHEGHGDNAAPSAYGGLRAVVPGMAGPRVIGLTLSGKVGFAYAAPAAPFSTSEARAALPERVSHETAVTALGRVVALREGLAQGDPELIRIGIEDELHVPYRLPRIKGAKQAVAAGYEAGAWGVTISGGGSGLIAVCPPSVAPEVAAAMREAFLTRPDEAECVGFEVRPDLDGMRRT